MLRGLGCDDNSSTNLSKLRTGDSLSPNDNLDVTIAVLKASPLTIMGKRIDRLIQSARVYINTDVFPQNVYNNLASSGHLQAQDTSLSETGVHWQNLAVAVCHVQEIDLLITQTIIDGQAISTSRTGVIGVLARNPRNFRTIFSHSRSL